MELYIVLHQAFTNMIGSLSTEKPITKSLLGFEISGKLKNCYGWDCVYIMPIISVSFKETSNKMDLVMIGELQRVVFDSITEIGIELECSLSEIKIEVITKDNCTTIRASLELDDDLT